MKIQNFKDLRIWQDSMDFTEQIYKLSRKFPKEELYGVTSQIRRSAVSIPSNIAEVFMRFSNKEFKHFLFIALASSAEVETQLILCERLGYLPKPKMTEFSESIDRLNRMIMTLIKKL